MSISRPSRSGLGDVALPPLTARAAVEADGDGRVGPPARSMRLTVPRPATPRRRREVGRRSWTSRPASGSLAPVGDDEGLLVLGEPRLEREVLDGILPNAGCLGGRPRPRRSCWPRRRRVECHHCEKAIPPGTGLFRRPRADSIFGAGLRAAVMEELLDVARCGAGDQAAAAGHPGQAAEAGVVSPSMRKVESRRPDASSRRRGSTSDLVQDGVDLAATDGRPGRSAGP